MTLTTTERVFTRRKKSTLVGASLVAAVSALSLGLGAGAAHATTTQHFDAEHVDMGFVSYDSTADKLVLGTNSDPTETYYAPGQVNAVPSGDPCGATPTYVDPEADFLVTGAAKVGSTWVLPDELTAGKLFPGFAGAGEEILDGTESLLDALTPDVDAVDVTLDCQAFVGTGTGTATLAFSGSAPEVTQTGNTYTFGLFDLDEAFHQHPTWTFTAAGTYYLTFHASVHDSGSGIGDSNQVTYKFVVSN